MNSTSVWLLSKYLHYMQFDMHKAMMISKLNQISKIISGRWLDVGAGDVPYKQYFANADEYLTTNTKSHYNANDILALEKKTTYWIEDGKKLPVADNSLDGVACFQVLSVIDKPQDFFREINRVLKPGGKLLITTDFIYPVWSNSDRHRFTAFSLNELCESRGFCAIDIESFGGTGAMLYSVLMRYVRSYPGIWRKRHGITKYLSALIYGVILMLLPVFSLLGMMVFLMEKNRKQDTDFTFNLLLIAEKKADNY